MSNLYYKNETKIIKIIIKIYLILTLLSYVLDLFINKSSFSIKKLASIIVITSITSAFYYRKNKFAALILEFTIIVLVISLMLTIFDLFHLVNGISLLILPLTIILIYYKLIHTYMFKEIECYFNTRSINKKRIIIENLILILTYLLYSKL